METLGEERNTPEQRVDFKADVGQRRPGPSLLGAGKEGAMSQMGLHQHPTAGVSLSHNGIGRNRVTARFGLEKEAGQKGTGPLILDKGKEVVIPHKGQI